MTAGIYYIENKITGKIYYGRTKNYEKRYGNNPIWAKHHNRELRDDAIKYGNEKFSYELVIETSPDFETLRAYENAVRDYFINTNQWDETYNRAKTDGPIDISGNNNPAKRPEVRAKISLKLKNKPKSIEHRLKISKTTKEIRKNPEIVIAMTGKKHTEEWKKRILSEKKDFVINTSKYKIKNVVDIILKQVNEKRKRNPNLHLIRKCW